MLTRLRLRDHRYVAERLGTALSEQYEEAYEAMLAAQGVTPRVEPEELTVFWPMVGHAWDSELMGVGRAVNGSMAISTALKEH